MLLCYKGVKNASGCLAGLVLCLTTSSLQIRNLRSCCPVHCTKPGARSFPHVLAVSLLAFLGHRGRGAAPWTLASIAAPFFPSFTFCLLEQKSGERFSSFWELWLPVLASCSAVSMTILAVSGLWAVLPGLQNRELGR